MNLIFLVALAAGGCGYVDPSALRTCNTQVIPVRCDNMPGTNKGAPKENLHINGPVRVITKNVCVEPGATLEFRVLPQSTQQLVMISPKEGSPDWLRGDNSDNRKLISIDIPPRAVRDRSWDYEVTLGDGRCLDPRIHVQ